MRRRAARLCTLIYDLSGRPYFNSALFLTHTMTHFFSRPFYLLNAHLHLTVFFYKDAIDQEVEQTDAHIKCFIRVRSFVALQLKLIFIKKCQARTQW